MFSEVEGKLIEALETLPHLNQVQQTVAPTVNPPVGVLTFDWPQDRDYSTGNISEVIYQWFFDLYFSMTDAKRAQVQMREVLDELKRIRRRDQSLGGVADRFDIENGGRAFPFERSLVKPVILRVTTEEVGEE